MSPDDLSVIFDKSSYPSSLEYFVVSSVGLRAVSVVMSQSVRHTVKGKTDCMTQGYLLITSEVVMTQKAPSQTRFERTKLDLL